MDTMNNLKKMFTLCLLSFSILIVISCSEENPIENQEEHFKTVSTNDALSFLNSAKSLQAKNTNEPYITGVYDSFLTQEEIVNSDELLTTVLVTTKYEYLLSRIVMLEINNEIKAVVFSMLPNSNVGTNDYTGEILITDLEGNFITGYKVVDNTFTYKYTLKNKSGNLNKNSTNETDGGDDCAGCPFYDCSLCDSFDEVEIIGTTGSNHPPYVSLANMYPVDGGEDLNNDWNFGGGSTSFSPDVSNTDFGDKPIYENTDKCQGIQDMWNMGLNSDNEMVGILTPDGSILVVAELDHNGGSFSGFNTYGQTVYYYYPASQGALNGNYGQILRNGNYFIPVAATLHTHTPCAEYTDGSDGITDRDINRDKVFADKYPNANHFIIGCGAIGQFNGNNNRAFNIQSGSLDELCNNVN